MSERKVIYYVVSSKRVETKRTSKRAAEEDVTLFRDIIGRSTWIEEVLQ